MLVDYRFTFITVLEQVDLERSEALRGPTRSLPCRARPVMCEAHSHEEEDGQYVQDDGFQSISGRPFTEFYHTIPNLCVSPFAPPKCIGRNESSDAVQDLQLIFGASSLDTGKESRSTADFFSDTVDSEFTRSSTSSSEACNPGSVGHPALCRRPCIFFAKNECRNSESCSFCHFSHAHRSSTLDKKQRQLLKELTRVPAFLTISPFHHETEATNTSTYQ